MNLKTTNIWVQKTDNIKDPINRDAEKIKRIIDVDLKKVKEEKDDNFTSRYYKHSVRK